MKRVEPYCVREDARGKLVGLMNEGKWEEFNYLETKAGEVRGNHYHKNTTELFFILDGEIRVELVKPGGSVNTQLVRRGDILLVEPGEMHTFHCVTDACWINALSQRFDDLNPDIYRYDD